jgi:hypothetical protein
MRQTQFHAQGIASAMSASDEPEDGANAVFHATGKHIRALPIRLENLLV